MSVWAGGVPAYGWQRPAFRVQTLHICILLSSVCRNIIFRPRSLRKRGAPGCRRLRLRRTPRRSARFLALVLTSSLVPRLIFHQTDWYFSTIDLILLAGN